jgi:hypothetical protein
MAARSIGRTCIAEPAGLAAGLNGEGRFLIAASEPGKIRGKLIRDGAARADLGLS